MNTTIIRTQKTREDILLHRAVVITRRMTDTSTNDKDLAHIIDVTTSAVGHWRRAETGTSAEVEACIAYVLGVDRDDLQPDGEAMPRFLSRDLTRFIGTYKLIRTNHRAYAIFVRNTGREPGSLEDFNWLVGNGIDVKRLDKALPDLTVFPPQHLTEDQLLAAVLDTPAPEAPAPVPEVPVASQQDLLRQALRDAEGLRKMLGLTWVIREDGSLGARRVTVEEF